MNGTQATRIALAAAVLISAGCISTVTVTPVEPGRPAEGFVYSLPKTYLEVRPKPDGSYDVGFHFLPDPEHTYAICARSYFAVHSLDVDLSEAGLLKSFDWQPDSTAVAEKAVDAVAKVYDEKVKAEEKAQEELKKEVESAKEAVGDAKEALASADKLLKQEQNKVEVIEFQLAQPGLSPEEVEDLQVKLLEAQLAVAVAQDDVTAAEVELAEAQAALALLGGASGGGSGGADEGGTGGPQNTAGAMNESASPQARAWGGVLFELRDYYDPADYEFWKDGKPIAPRTRLVAATTDDRPQVAFEAGGPPQGSGATKPLEFNLKGGSEVLLPRSRPEYAAAQQAVARTVKLVAVYAHLDANDEQRLEAEKEAALAKHALEVLEQAAHTEPLRLTVVATGPVEGFEAVELKRADSRYVWNAVDAFQVSKTELAILMLPYMPPGSYDLRFDYQLKTADGRKSTNPGSIPIFRLR